MRRPWLRPLSLVVLFAFAGGARAQAPSAPPGVLTLLGITPSAQSRDYVEHKTQFQLHTLLTEQRHPRTFDLGERVQSDVPAALSMLFSVDDDVSARLASLAQKSEPLAALSAAVERALVEKRKIYVYGCGATGRLAKQMESTFWRPFWRRVLGDAALKKKLDGQVAADVADALVGEMTGADRALISSLEGFEDLQLIGRRQLADHGVQRGDLVIAVTEGGETSSVIGTILGARETWRDDDAEARRHLFFVYNNPDDRLLPFERSRRVLEDRGITKLNLTTGPQAITGSTRMQATTSETFVVAHALQDAAARFLRHRLSAAELGRIGLAHEVTLAERMNGFSRLLAEVKKAAPQLAALTTLESDTYRGGAFSTYFAGGGLITVFIDSTERSPTFRLFPLDTVKEPKRRCWIQVWTSARDLGEAWHKMLGRPFRGLDPAFYRQPFATEIDDPYLRKAALDSLTRAGDEQQALYDFSFSPANVARSGPGAGDLGVVIAVDDEGARLGDAGSDFRGFATLFAERGARLGYVVVGTARAAAPPVKNALVVRVPVGSDDDPFHVNQQIALKVLLNAHSTAVMARLGKVVGNTMTNVSPSNLKLIGRATYLIQLHVNDVLARPAWIAAHGRHAPVSYAEANAVLFDDIAFVAGKKDLGGQNAAEVSLSIVRILESVKRRRAVTPAEALEIVKADGLGHYLSSAAPKS